ncbi:hypothetical protein [Xanthomonas campestris]|uniref:hypothetical protein n=1 Tax=Xanthomonas campestris TaxID=339 RepID=UPI002B2365D7|nr:hypothetical protein [Xanthomonas campestris]MEA9920604.1 hypothetical protein [Xanthomonas campestris pv. raphani]
MIVVDHAPADWFLLCDADDGYWLDVNCNMSATGFSILLLLNAKERADIDTDPHVACARLAAQVQAAPHAYAIRDLSGPDGSRVVDAVQAWRAAAGGNAAD